MTIGSGAHIQVSVNSQDQCAGMSEVKKEYESVQLGKLCKFYNSQQFASPVVVGARWRGRGCSVSRKVWLLALAKNGRIFIIDFSHGTSSTTSTLTIPVLVGWSNFPAAMTKHQ